MVLYCSCGKTAEKHLNMEEDVHDVHGWLSSIISSDMIRVPIKTTTLKKSQVKH